MYDRTVVNFLPQNAHVGLFLHTRKFKGEIKEVIFRETPWRKELNLLSDVLITPVINTLGPIDQRLPFL